MFFAPIGEPGGIRCLGASAAPVALRYGLTEASDLTSILVAKPVRSLFVASRFSS
jgi:hypothetical protein